MKGELDVNMFRFFHYDLVSHNYSNIDPDVEVCYQQVQTSVPNGAAAAAAQDPVKFNVFVPWLIARGALDGVKSPS